MKLLIDDALIVTGEHTPFRGWLLADGDRIAALGPGEYRGADLPDETLHAAGRMLMPGAIDTHVHFREPGLTHKATIASESRAALAGGVTSFIDMPNTKPATLGRAELEAKMEIAARDAAVCYGFMIGASADNIDELRRTPRSLSPAIKLFMGSSTGNMLLDDDTHLRRLFDLAAEQQRPIVVHAEDQAVIDRVTAGARIDDPTDMRWHSWLRPAECCVRATERAMELATRYGTRLHVAHVTTAAECALFDPADSPAGKQITAEVSPHHLINTINDYARAGARIKMNPAVKTEADRDALRAALLSGRIDSVATDHAPHLPAEKQGDVFHAVSGAPLVQFSLPVMLDMYDDASLVVRRMCHAPAEIFGIRDRGYLRPGYYADLVLVEKLTEPHVITDAEVVSLCGWTPLAGRTTSHRVVRTIVSPRPLEYR